MNTILQQRIEEAAEKYVEQRFSTRLLHDLYGRQSKSDFIEGATFALQNQWISVDKSLPPCPDDDEISEVSIKVIARTSEGVIRYAYYHHYLQQWFSAETSTRIDNVTKWMFVPEEGGEK